MKNTAFKLYVTTQESSVWSGTFGAFIHVLKANSEYLSQNIYRLTTVSDRGREETVLKMHKGELIFP